MTVPPTIRSSPRARRPFEFLPAPPRRPSATRAAAPDPTGTASAANESTLEALASALATCQRCQLASTRTHVVFGEGNPRARLMFVGEAPGETEDLQGRPFVGRAGQLLDRMVEAISLKRGDVYIANVVKCRPPGNRNPESVEIATCSPFLLKQIEFVQPEVIVALGRFAAQTLLRQSGALAPEAELKISAVRGQWLEYAGKRLMVTFHPAYLLRNPPAKREVWADLKQVAHVLGLPLATPSVATPREAES